MFYGGNMKTLLRNKIEDALANLDPNTEGRKSKHMKLSQDEILEILKSDRCYEVRMQARLRINDIEYSLVYPSITKKQAISMIEIDNLQDDKTYEVMVGFLKEDRYRIFSNKFKVVFLS
jgi:hypothetical protein